MRPRTIPINLEAGPHYVAVQLSTREAPVYLRRLLPRRSAELIRWMHETEMASKAELSVVEQGGTAKDQWAARELALGYLAAIQGRFLGLMLALPDHELVSQAAEHPTPEAFGEAVIEEMWEVGWSAAEIEALWGAALQVCVRSALYQSLDGTEVKRLLDFGKRPEEPMTSSSSPPGSNITATPSLS